jgi:small-conductance mechanosensitive channel
MENVLNQYREVFYVLIILVGAFVISKSLRFLLHRLLVSNSKKLNVDPTNYSFLKNTLGVLIWALALVVIAYAVPQLKGMATALLAGAGFLAAALAFASQEAVSNIISGIFIIAFKPFRVGDLIQVDGSHDGVVEDITLRHTVIRDFQNRRVIIPNAAISKATIINAHLVDEKICKHFIIGVSYDSDVAKAKQIIRQEAEQHPLCIDNRTEEEKTAGAPVVMVRTLSLADSSILLRANIWAASPADAFEIQCELNDILKNRFDQEGIEIPYPYRNLVIRNEGKSPI